MNPSVPGVDALPTPVPEASAPADASDSLRALPRVLIKPRRAQPFFYRHPWVYRTAIHSISGKQQPGDEVAVYTHEGDFLARGLFNPNSEIVVRLYSWDAETPLDDAFFEKRIEQALAVRRRLPMPWGTGAGSSTAAPFPADTGCRLIFSESDGLSGLTVDRYGEWLLVQITSLAMARRKDHLVKVLQQQLSPRGIWLRTEKGIRDTEGLEAADGLIAGEPPPRPLVLCDGDVRYQVDVVEGQKTGFYLDQSSNRAAAARYLGGARVLDLFCYSGGFGITALKQGAREVLAVDVSESALALAAANAELNGVADRIRFEKAKAFEALERLRAAGEKFDAVVLDPPKMARNRASLKQALKGYFSLNRLALDVLNPGGILVTCSCTGLVMPDDFRDVLSSVAVKANRTLRVLEFRGASPDHPSSVHCPETNYLKCVIAVL
jgi:23S rRNA (cytosine1962-C5)-methyltransferase